MRIACAAVFLGLLTSFSAVAHLGDSPQQAVMRYGASVADSEPPAAQTLTSTQTFEKDGIVIVCGYVADHVEMIQYTRSDRPYLQVEVDAMLHTNVAKGQPWTEDPAKPGTYHRPDGTIAHITETTVDISTPKWRDSLAKDEAALTKGAGVAPSTSSNSLPVSASSGVNPSSP